GGELRGERPAPPGGSAGTSGGIGRHLRGELQGPPVPAGRRGKPLAFVHAAGSACHGLLPAVLGRRAPCPHVRRVPPRAARKPLPTAPRRAAPTSCRSKTFRVPIRVCRTRGRAPASCGGSSAANWPGS